LSESKNEQEINDALQNQESVLEKMRGMASDDAEMKESPFVYLMNRAKMELMARDDHMSVPA